VVPVEDTTAEMSSPVEDLNLLNLNRKTAITETSEDIPCPALDEIYSRHQKSYLDKLLIAERLDKAEWSDFIRTNCDKILRQVEIVPEVNPWTKQIVMDIRDLVKVKFFLNINKIYIII
jgi:hypothetical protein